VIAISSASSLTAILRCAARLCGYAGQPRQWFGGPEFDELMRTGVELHGRTMAAICRDRLHQDVLGLALRP
jgi:hypothetical protein